MLHVRLPKARRTSGPSGPPGSEPTLALRLRVHLHRGRLDHQIADGFDVVAFEDRALRAGQLAGMPARRRVARSLRDVVKAADRPALVSSAVPVSRRTVVPWREALLGLAERLERPEPVNPCGVARALVVLTDGGGPLYGPGAARSMGESVWWIADGLGPCPPHDWGCPVIMKLDPEHIAWTCRRCGAIATSEDSRQLPN
jgi:hypothetical protein